MSIFYKEVLANENIVVTASGVETVLSSFTGGNIQPYGPNGAVRLTYMGSFDNENQGFATASVKVTLAEDGCRVDGEEAFPFSDNIGSHVVIEVLPGEHYFLAVVDYIFHPEDYDIANGVVAYSGRYSVRYASHDDVVLNGGYAHRDYFVSGFSGWALLPTTFTLSMTLHDQNVSFRLHSMYAEYL